VILERKKEDDETNDQEQIHDGNEWKVGGVAGILFGGGKGERGGEQVAW